MDKDDQQTAERMPPPERDPSPASTDGPKSEPNDARRQILELKAQAEELRTVGYKWQKAAQAALAAERQLTELQAARDGALAKAAEAQAVADDVQRRSENLEADLEKLRGERDAALARAAEAQAAADEAQKRAVVLDSEIEQVRAERDGALAKAAVASDAQAGAEEDRQRSMALEAEVERLRGECDAARASVSEAQAAADEARKRSAAQEAEQEKLRGERDSALAKVEEYERAARTDGVDAHGVRRELAVNGIAAVCLIAVLLIVAFLKG